MIVVKQNVKVAMQLVPNVLVPQLIVNLVPLNIIWITLHVLIVKILA